MDEALGLRQGVQSPSAVKGFCSPSRLAFPGRPSSGFLLLGERGLCLRPPQVRLFSISPPCAVCVLSLVQLCATPCTGARQAPLSMGFFRQEYWSGLPFPPPGHLP